ncbi:MAG: PepSY domain-containing protein [Holosporales bacterium]
MLALLFRWHVRLGYVAGAVLILWAASGILHPVLSFTQVRPVAFVPPVVPIDSADAQPLSALSGLPERVSGLRLLSLQGLSVYQLTMPETKERRYYRADTGAPLPSAEMAHAEILARHYSGEKNARIAAIHTQTAFSESYPKINTYLPAIKVIFDRPDTLSVYVSTANDRLGTVNTDTKELLLAWFQRIHTLSFLKPLGDGRIVIIALSMLVAFSMAGLGIGLLWKLRRPKTPHGLRGLHRRLAWLVFVPILLFSSTGLFHLLVTSYAKPTIPVAVPSFTVALAKALPNLETGIALLDARLIQLDEKTRWRVEYTAAGAKHGDIAYYSIDTGERLLLTDADAAQSLAASLLPDVEFSGAPTRVLRYNSEYGFANKRLPVWRLEATDGTLVFIDTKDAVIAAKVGALHKAELWTFNTLHKGQFMDKLFGLKPPVRDGVLVAIASLIIIMSVFGIVLTRRRQRS